MENILTADQILQISPLDYKEALTVLKYCDFNSVRRIGLSYIIDKDEFLAWAERKKLAVDRDKLENKIPA